MLYRYYCIDAEEKLENLKEMSNEPPNDKTNEMAVRPAKTDQSGHLPSLIRDCAVRMKEPCALSYPFSGDSDQTGRMPRLI